MQRRSRRIALVPTSQFEPVVMDQYVHEQGVQQRGIQKDEERARRSRADLVQLRDALVTFVVEFDTP